MGNPSMATKYSGKSSFRIGCLLRSPPRRGFSGIVCNAPVRREQMTVQKASAFPERYIGLSSNLPDKEESGAVIRRSGHQQRKRADGPVWTGPGTSRGVDLPQSNPFEHCRATNTCTTSQTVFDNRRSPRSDFRSDVGAKSGGGEGGREPWESTKIAQKGTKKRRPAARSSFNLLASN